MKRWSIDPDHSVARFSVRHFMIANVEGLFSNMTGVIQFDPPDIGRLSVETEIDAKSLTTGNRERDEHLLGPDYFDADRYPKIFFKSNTVQVAEAHRGQVIGELSIRGIKRPVTLDFEFSGPVKSPFSGKTCIGFSASGRVIRSDYGMTWNEAMEGGGPVMGLDVEIHMELEADLIVNG
jgi:polyisoprenoid-binding protein YceI